MGSRILEIMCESIALVIGGTILLRLSGKKALSEMTMASTVVMFSLGQILAEPILNKDVWETMIAMAGFLATLVVLERLQLKYNWFERIFFGKPLEIIVDGEVLVPNLRKLRVSIDDLEMRLREKGVSKIEDVQAATMEVNGRIAVELKPYARPVTLGDLEKLLAEWDKKKVPDANSDGAAQSQGKTNAKGNLFMEVKLDDSGQQVPPQLQ